MPEVLFERLTEEIQRNKCRQKR